MLRGFLQAVIHLIGICCVLGYGILNCWPPHYRFQEHPDHQLNGITEILDISPEFTETERKQILAAGKEWEMATGRGIRFQYSGQGVPDQTGNLSNQDSELTQTIVIEPIDEKSVLAFWLDLTAGDFGSVLGFYDYQNRKVSIIRERISSKGMFLGVIIHELGHTIFLDHSPYPLSVMFPYVDESNAQVNYDDVEAICKVVKCGATAGDSIGPIFWIL